VQQQLEATVVSRRLSTIRPAQPTSNTGARGCIGSSPGRISTMPITWSPSIAASVICR
jgi:hypothetical protein